MELSLCPSHQNSLTLLHKPLFSVPFSGKRLPKKSSFLLPCFCALSSSDDTSKPAILSLQHEGRRALVGSLLTAAAAMYVCDVAEAVSTSRRALRGAKIPESEFTTLPNGLKYYDLKVGSGLKAVKGSRVAPYGFDVGQSERGNVLKGLDLGVEGMCVGGQRLLIVPPELAYGKKGVQEIPPNATIELDVELLAIKQSPFGTPVKVVEG
ncbi:peptidyl-prolyl cis-trans isomerase FKBP16-4, chloroplastic isoform X3 [Herrania umbratica]|uniref:peptidylprolyl isomerase n=1 Tax=Herrania umbratica TaxID=108875 RepID=A0A6J1APM6_9ROSI|nr:peptidyl-prolyl cis-trans isomerase FKBP16-4, chloroplastic isoform X3 [Herrania umbratica]